MEYRAWFECINGCKGEHPLNSVIYSCPECGNLLKVCHDSEALKQKSGEEWKALFDKRFMRTEWPYGSSVWGKKELVCPTVDNDNIVSMFEGGSNLFWAERLGRRVGIEGLWVKQCGNSHTGSFKDLGMTVLVSMVKQMRAEGKNIPAVACASTGDTSAALAAYCAAANIQAVVFLPRNKVSIPQLIQPLSNGAITLSLDTDFDGCMRLVKEVCGRNNIYLANSMNSLRIEGQKTVSIEIAQQLDWEAPDWVIIPGGNLGNMAALGKGFLMMEELGIIDRRPRLVCAQAENANPLYESYLKGFKEFKPKKAKKTLASAIQIGDPVSVQKAIYMLKEFDGVVEQASEDELSNAAALADTTGLFCCPHTGVALAALFKLRERGIIGSGDKVIVISTAHGLKFTDFKLKYHTGKLRDVEATHRNEPIQLAPKYEDVIDTINRELERRAV